jgi:hypothetical protein
MPANREIVDPVQAFREEAWSGLSGSGQFIPPSDKIVFNNAY